MAPLQMIILHSLVILSLIIPNLATYTPQPASIQQPLSQRSEPVLTSNLLPPSLQPSATPEPEDTPASSATPEPEDPPTSDIPSSESAPESDDPAYEAELAAYLLSQIPSNSPLLASDPLLAASDPLLAASDPLLAASSPTENQISLRLAALQAPQPGASLTLAYQIGAPLSAENYQLQVHAPAAAVWQGKDPSLFNAASQTLDLPLEYPSGLLSFSIDPQALGPFEFQFSLLQSQPNLESSSQPLASLTLSLSESGLTQIPAGGGWASAFDGQVQVQVPPAAAPQALTLRIRSPLGEARPPRSPSGQPFEILAHSAADQQALTQFAEPLTIQVRYARETLRGPEEQLRLAYYDPKSQAWIKLPTRVDPQNQRLSATSDHLTVFDVTFDDWQEALLPSLQAFQVSEFSAAASASYSFWTPPGPGGLQPSLSLHYNSQMVDNAIAGHTQAGWVGMGWSLNTGSIERNMRGTLTNPNDDVFSISAAGVDSLLLIGEDGRYHSLDESFWRIVYDQNYDVWQAWDKSGNLYTFGGSAGSRASYPYGYDIDCQEENPPPEAQPRTWRWALSKVRNVSGQELTYTYTQDTQDKLHPCLSYLSYPATLATYPQTILYPGGQYRVSFELEARGDYNTTWENEGSYNFYERRRLKAVHIERFVGGDFEKIRSYQLSYAGEIFPGVLWSKGQVATQALVGIQESRTVGGQTYSLPPISYSYDGLHLVTVENGYGGRIEYVYESQPWRAEGVDLRSKGRIWAPPSECKEIYPGNYQPYFIPYGEDSNAFCIENINDLYLVGNNFMNIPAGMLQPGGVYRLQISLFKKRGMGIGATVKVGLLLGDGTTLAAKELYLGVNQGVEINEEVLLPANASAVRMWVYCSTACEVVENDDEIDKLPTVKLLPVRYRLQAKQVYDGLNPAPQIFTFSADEPSMNDVHHSQAVASEPNPFHLPYTEFRGNAFFKQVAPDGRAQLTFFHQDDDFKGRPALQAVMQQSFEEDFDTGASLSTDWSLCSGAVVELPRLYGDPAARLSAASAETCLKRQTFNLADSQGQPNAVIGQFLIPSAENNNPQARLGLESDSGLGFALRVRTDGALEGQYNLGTGWLSEATPLLPPGSIQKDAWYVFLLIIDEDENFLARFWPRQQPLEALEYRRSFIAGQSLPAVEWRFGLYAQNGAAYLDAYSEGSLFSLSASQWERQAYNLGSGNPTGLGGLNLGWVFPARQVDWQFDGDASYSATRRSYTYDVSYGNPQRSLEAAWDAEVSAWRDVRLALSAYEVNTNGVYLVGLPAVEQTYACPANSLDEACLSLSPTAALLLAEQRYLYDGQFSGQPSQGLLTGRRSLLRFAGEDYSQPRYADQMLAYDAWGNLTAVTHYSAEGTASALASSGAQVTSSAYDPVFHTYPMSQTNALEQTTSFSYDFDLGLPLSLSGPNGASSTVSAWYDPFGRLLGLARPGDDLQQPTLQFTYHDQAQPFRIEASQRIQGSQYAVTRRYYDGLGRLVQSQSLLNGQALVTDQSYTAHGELLSQSMPHSQSDTGSYLTPPTGLAANLFAYDPLGRLIQSTAPDGSSTQTDYGLPLTASGLRQVQTLDALDRASTSWLDAWGQVVRAIPPQENGQALHPELVFEYDPLGRLLQAQRGVALTSLQYDLGGRKTALQDADMGAWSYAYDALGNLVEQTDARGCVTSLSYDGLNRLVGKSYSNASGGNCAAIVANAAPVSYSYDQGVNGIGQRTGMSDASGSVSWSYDARGRLVSELRQVGSYGSFASAWGYNSADGLAWRQYPGGNNGQLGELVSYSYDQRLQLATVTGDYAYVSASAYDAAGRLVQRSLGNAAVLSQYSYYPWEQQGGRLQQLLSGTPADSDSLQDLRYTHDLSGNLLSLQDYLAGAPQTQVFDYDALDRLVSASASGGSNGLGDYSLEMAYDPGSGNLSQKGELYYRYLDSGHSHAVTAVSDGWRYEYDPNGNLVRKAYRPGLYFPLVLLTEPEETLGEPPESQAEPTSPYPLPEEQSRAEPAGLLAWLHSAWDFLTSRFGGGVHTAQAAALQQDDPTPTPDPSPPEPPEVIEYGYDAENRLVSVSAGEMQVSFLYDGDGQRVASLIDGEATVYIGEVFEWDVTTGSMTRYYYAGAQRVAIRTGSASPVWLLGDHLGSTSVAANTDGSLLSRQGYLPWGELRYTEGSLPGRYQFTGQASYEAEFGLYYYKARWYDPHLGRFSQPDSIVPDPGNPLDWDRYQYARANPLKYTDPTGHFPWLLIPIFIFIATIPGDTGPYEVDPVTSAVGDAALRFVDPIDAVFTGVECLQGQCSGVDILFAILPVVNGGLDDLGEAANHLDDLAIKPGSLSNVDARKWYLAQEARIKGLIDSSLSLEEQAKQAFDLRNQYRTQARNLMADRELAEKLMREEPNLTWEQVIQKAKDKGYSGDDIYQYIIDSSQRSRPSVNTDLGVYK